MTLPDSNCLQKVLSPDTTKHTSWKFKCPTHALQEHTETTGLGENTDYMENQTRLYKELGDVLPSPGWYTQMQTDIPEERQLRMVTKVDRHVSCPCSFHFSNSCSSGSSNILQWIFLILFWKLSFSGENTDGLSPSNDLPLAVPAASWKACHPVWVSSCPSPESCFKLSEALLHPIHWVGYWRFHWLYKFQNLPVHSFVWEIFCVIYGRNDVNILTHQWAWPPSQEARSSRKIQLYSSWESQSTVPTPEGHLSSFVIITSAFWFTFFTKKNYKEMHVPKGPKV